MPTRPRFRRRKNAASAIVLLDPAKVNARRCPSDAELQKEYNANMDKFRTPERVNVRHILIKSDASNDAPMKAKAEGILKQMQAGDDFAKLAEGQFAGSRLGRRWAENSAGS